MLKIIIRSPLLFRRLMRYPRFRPWLPFDLSRLEKINDEATFVFALQATRLPNGTCKTTNIRRFKSLDDTICKHAIKFSKPVKVHDVAASDGITSVNLSDALSESSIVHSVRFSDKFSNLYTRRSGLSRIVYDQEGVLIYADFFGLLASPYLPKRFWLSKWLGYAYSEKHERKPDETEILLLNPIARRRIAAKQLDFFYYDLFDSKVSDETYQVVRCMNALNPAIFSESKLRSAVTKLAENLEEKGILVIGRTNPSSGENHATIFQRRDSALVVLERHGDGSEIETIVLSCQSFNKAS